MFSSSRNQNQIPKNCIAQAILFYVGNYSGKNLFKRSNQIIYAGFQNIDGLEILSSRL